MQPPRHSENGTLNEVRITNPKNLAANVCKACGEMLRFGFRRLRCTPVLSMTPLRASVGFTGSFAALRMSAQDRVTRLGRLGRRIQPPRHSEKRTLNEIRITNPKNLTANVCKACGEMLRFGFRRLRCAPVLSMTPLWASVGFTGSFAALRMNEQGGGHDCLKSQTGRKRCGGSRRSFHRGKRP